MIINLDIAQIEMEIRHLEQMVEWFKRRGMTGEANSYKNQTDNLRMRLDKLVLDISEGR